MAYAAGGDALAPVRGRQGRLGRGSGGVLGAPSSTPWGDGAWGWGRQRDAKSREYGNSCWARRRLTVATDTLSSLTASQAATYSRFFGQE
jgi:hypothetical protein